MSYDLTSQSISTTFQNLLQKTGSGNQLYDLEGNAIQDLTIGGALHAQSYIVSQSTTVHTSGSTQFGNSADDTHTFQGNITASGDISSSGTVRGTNVNAVSALTSDILITTSNISIGSNITASGDISSSGTIQASNIKLNGNKFVNPGHPGNFEIGNNGASSLNLNHITASGNLDVDGIIEAETGSFEHGRFTGRVGIGAADPGYKLHVNGNTRVEGRITLNTNVNNYLDVDSNDVVIKTNQNFKLFKDTNEPLFWDGTNSRLGIGKSTATKTLEVAGDMSGSGDLHIEGNITASNVNISSHISSSYDTDSRSVFGRAFVGYAKGGIDIFSDEAAFGHIDQISPTVIKGYALRQSSTGVTHINSNNGPLNLMIEGITKLQISESANRFNEPLLLGGGTGENPISTPNPKALQVYGDISASGNYYTGTDVIISGSGTLMAGSHGNQSRIKLLARDFNPDDDSGRPMYIEDDTSNEIFMRTHNAQSVYASVEVPMGYKATDVIVYGNDTSNTVDVYRGNITGSAVFQLDGGSCVVGSSCDITDLVANDENFLWVQVTTAANSDYIYGGYVTITKA